MSFPKLIVQMLNNTPFFKTELDLNFGLVKGYGQETELYEKKECLLTFSCGSVDFTLEVKYEIVWAMSGLEPVFKKARGYQTDFKTDFENLTGEEHEDLHEEIFSFILERNGLKSQTLPL